MNKLLTTLFALCVASATSLALAQQPAPAAPAAPAAAPATAPAAAKPAAPMDPKRMEAKTAICYGCHNILDYQTNFPEVYKVPKIAGQNAKYLAAALTAYKNGDRKHPTMRSVAGSLSDQDIQDIANYYANLGKDQIKPIADKPNREPDAQVAALLQKANCQSCHGSNFSKPIDPSYPKLAGQHWDYIYAALKAYKTSDSPAFGRNNGIMGAMAKQFSNDELKAIAHYVGSLDGEVATIPESRFHRQ
jgi:cytochrome c553